MVHSQARVCFRFTKYPIRKCKSYSIYVLVTYGLVNSFKKAP